MIRKHILQITFLNKPEYILQTVEWFKVLSFSNISFIQIYPFVCIQYKWFQVLLYVPNDSIEH